MARPKKNVIRFSSTIPEALYKQLHNYAEDHGMTLTGVMQVALKEYMAKDGTGVRRAKS